MHVRTSGSGHLHREAPIKMRKELTASLSNDIEHSRQLASSYGMSTGIESISEGFLFVPGDIAGSFDRCKRFLGELEFMTGHASRHNESPVLELQMADVVVAASIEPDQVMPYLLISTLLPRYYQNASSGETSSSAALPMATSRAARATWGSSNKRFVLMQKIPINEFPDERSLLDAVIQAAREASRWQEFL